MQKYTDEQNVLIAQKEYEKYSVNDEVFINDKNTGKDITVGYVAEVIHHNTGADVYVVTDVKLPENPTEADRAKVKRVTMLYQGSTQLVEDWLVTNPSLGWHVTTGGVFLPEFPLEDWLATNPSLGRHLATREVFLPELPLGSVALSTVDFSNKLSGSGFFIAEQSMARHSSENTKNFPSTVKSCIPQLAISSIILNSTMEKFPNAMFDLYAHSLGSSECQYSLGMCPYPERINSAWLYNGPNGYTILPLDGKKIPDFLFSRIHIIYDPHDPVGWAYWRKKSVGIVSAVKTENLGNSISAKKKQHGWGAYIFDHFGNHIDTDGNIVIKNTGFSEFDINRDGLPDIYFNNINNQHIFSDYSDLSNLKNLNFNLDFQYSPLQFSKIGIDIQLNPELLHTLISNTISDIEISLSVMLGICTLCMESNSEVGDKKEDRKTTVYESIAEVFRNCNITLILENLHASVGVFTKNSKVFENLSIQKTLILDSFNDDNVPYTGNKHCPHYLPSSYNNYLLQLANEAANMFEICRTQKCDDNSIISQSQLAIIKSWKNVEDIYEELLQESEKTFEGKGIRVGRKDAIQQSVTDVLDIEASNIKELQNILINLKSFMTVTTTSFDDKDAYLGSAIETGIDFSTNALVPGVPQNYEAYLNRSEIFDDVKDVLQAFDMQVEENSKDYAKKVKQVYDENLGNFEHTLSIWLEQANNFKEKVNTIRNSFNENVSVRKKHYYHYLSKTGNYIETYSYVHSIWGKLRDLYSSTLVDNVETAAEKILPVIPIIEATINSSKTAKDKLGNIEPALKKIIEDGVYKAFDLMEVVQSQKIVLQLAVKCKLQIRFVIDSINNASMKGRAITTIHTKLLQIERLLE